MNDIKVGGAGHPIKRYNALRRVYDDGVPPDKQVTVSLGSLTHRPGTPWDWYSILAFGGVKG